MFLHAGLLSDIDASVVVIDCEFNMDGHCSPVRKNGLVLRHFYSKTPNVCQDRLGTNIGKVNTKAILSLSQVETLNRTLVFIRALKAKRPEMPVLLIEGHDHARAWISPPTALQQNQTREAYRR